MNPFETLEIAPGATPDEIKAAYHRLAKIWHPDRFVGAEKVEAENRFRKLAEAFNMLKDPARRLEMESRATKGDEPAGVPTATANQKPVAERSVEDWFKEAKEAFQAKDYSRALGLIHYTIRLDPNRAEAWVLMAQLLDLAGGDKRTKVRALENAIRINPKDVESMIHLAGTFQELGMQAKANRIREEARQLAPNHKIFRKVVASPAKGTSSKATQAEGILGQLRDLIGRLFKKG